ncbi:MAG: hypothetical protein KDI50_05475 [Candidatus Competibacteraceae bacterium]|nr:hypothetical protein [Candidatus Competibacteraceae bacterium]
MTDDDSHKVPESGIEAFKAAVCPPKKRLSDRQKIRDHLPEIRRKLDEGWPYKEVLAELQRTLDVRCKLRTIYDYVEKFSRQEKKPRRRASKATAKRAPASKSKTIRKESIDTNSAVEAVHPPEIPSEISSETPHRRRVAEMLCDPEYLERMREQKQKKEKPKSTMVDMVNRRV